MSDETGGRKMEKSKLLSEEENIKFLKGYIFDIDKKIERLNLIKESALQELQELEQFFKTKQLKEGAE